MPEKEIRIKLLSFDYRILDLWVRKIVAISSSSEAVIKGPIPLPTKKKLYTVLKSPHVNKPSMEQFEKKMHKRLIIIQNYSMQLISDFQKLNLPSSVDLSFVIK